MTDITDLGADAASESQQNSSSGDYESDYERFDLDGCAFGKQHPTTAVRGEAVALRKLWDENDPDRADVAVIFDDPSIVTDGSDLEGTVVVQSEEEGDQFKVVNTDDDQTKVLEDMGIDFAGNTFYGDVEDDFTSDRIALKRGGGAGRSITAVLDVKGAVAAETVSDENGDPVLHDGGFPEKNGGLIEYHPDGRDGEMPRYARDPELRPDVAGTDVVVMLQRLADIDPDYDGPAYWSTVFANVEDERMDELAEQYAENTETEDGEEKQPEDFIAELDGDRFLRLQPTDEFEPDEDLLRDTGYIQWQRPDLEDLNEAREAEGFDAYDPDGSDSGSSSTDTEDEADAE